MPPYFEHHRLFLPIGYCSSLSFRASAKYAFVNFVHLGYAGHAGVFWNDPVAMGTIGHFDRSRKSKEGKCS